MFIKNDPIELDMQYFAEEPEEVNQDQNETEEENEQKEEKQEEKTFTQEEVDEIVQARLAREKNKHKKDLTNAISEGKRLAELSSEERKAEEAKREKDELTKREQKLKRRELELDTKERLTEENIPQEFASFLIGVDGDTTNDNIKSFKPVFDKAVSKKAEKLLKDTVTVPKSGGGVRDKAGSFGRKLGESTKETEKKHNFF